MALAKEENQGTVWCCVCNVENDSPSVVVRMGRLRYIRPWRPINTTVRSRAHVDCLDRIGLCQIPNKQMIVGLKESASLPSAIRKIVHAVPRTGDLLSMCDQAWDDVVRAYGSDGEVTDPAILALQTAIRFNVTASMGPWMPPPPAVTSSGPDKTSETPPTQVAEPPSPVPIKTEEETMDTNGHQHSGDHLPSIEWLQTYGKSLERALELEKVARRRARIAAKKRRTREPPAPTRRVKRKRPRRSAEEEDEDVKNLASVVRAIGRFASVLSR